MIGKEKLVGMSLEKRVAISDVDVDNIRCYVEGTLDYLNNTDEREAVLMMAGPAHANLVMLERVTGKDYSTEKKEMVKTLDRYFRFVVGLMMEPEEEYVPFDEKAAREPEEASWTVDEAKQIVAYMKNMDSGLASEMETVVNYAVRDR